MLFVVGVYFHPFAACSYINGNRLIILLVSTPEVSVCKLSVKLHTLSQSTTNYIYLNAFSELHECTNFYTFVNLLKYNCVVQLLHNPM